VHYQERSRAGTIHPRKSRRDRPSISGGVYHEFPPFLFELWRTAGLAQLGSLSALGRHFGLRDDFCVSSAVVSATNAGSSETL